MSLIDIQELPSHSVRFGERGKKEHVRQFLGISNNAYDQPESIARSRLCPKVGTEDHLDGTCIIIDVDVQRRITDEPGYFWTITYTSSTEFDDNQHLSPLSLPTAYNWSPQQYERYTEKDNRGRFIKTAAGTIIPEKVEDSRWVIAARKNLAKPPAYLLNFNNALNSGSVVVDGIRFAKQLLMCKGLRIGEVQRETYRGVRLEYREVSFELHYRKEGWKARTPNADMVELRDAEFLVKERDGSIRLDRDGTPVRRRRKQRVKIMIGEPKEYIDSPWPLRRDGSALPEDYQPEDVTYIESDVYKTLDFNALPLR